MGKMHNQPQPLPYSFTHFGTTGLDDLSASCDPLSYQGSADRCRSLWKEWSEFNLHANSPMASRGHCLINASFAFVCFLAKFDLFLPANSLISALTPSVVVSCSAAKQPCWWRKQWRTGVYHGNPLQHSCLENPMDGGA